jgi:excisionase family DNA binding protein
MTAYEVALHLHITQRTVTNLAVRGFLPGIQLGTLWRFSRRAIDSLMNPTPNSPGVQP